MFMKNQMIYDDFMLQVLKSDKMIDYERISKAFVEHEAKIKEAFKK